MMQPIVAAASRVRARVVSEAAAAHPVSQQALGVAAGPGLGQQHSLRDRLVVAPFPALGMLANAHAQMPL